MSGESRFPLTWPPGWRRTERYRRRSAQFKNARARVSVAVALDRIAHELQLLAGSAAADNMLVSTNIPTRIDGMPRSDRAEPADPGAAVYWRVRSGRTGNDTITRCMAIDIYDRAADNLAAIAATLEAMRAIERHGGATILDRAFQGFMALPAPEQWFQVLGVSAHASREEIELAHRRLAAQHHPDRDGGDDAQMARINVARDDGLAATA